MLVHPSDSSLIDDTDKYLPTPTFHWISSNHFAKENLLNNFGHTAVTKFMLTDIVPDIRDFGPIPEKLDKMSGVYMGNDTVLTKLWTGHIFLTSSKDMIVTPHLINIGINEPHNTRTLVSLVKPGDVFVDVGANVGYFSVLAGWRAYPGGEIWSFEPNPAAYAILSDNMTNTGHAAMAKRWPVALSDQPGTASLRIFPGYEATSTLRDVPADYIAHTERETGRLSHTINVDVMRLDDVMRDIPEIHVMKIDAEGHEPAVIAGAQDILRRSPNVKVVMEFVPPILKPMDAKSLLVMVRQLGFSIFRIDFDSTLTFHPDDQSILDIPFSDLLLLKR